MENQAADIAKRPAVQVEVRPRDEALHTRKRHRGEGVFVESFLTLDVRPKLELSWGVQPSYWKSTLLVFHSTSGFCPTDRPDDLGQHGRLIIETIRNDKQTLFLEEGTHYFTFVLRRSSFMSWFGEYRSKPLRFSLEVPSANVVMKRIKDQTELLNLQHTINLTPLKQETQLNDTELKLIESRRRLDRARNPSARSEKKPEPPTNPQIAAELRSLDGFLDAVAAKESKREEMINSPAFQKLSPEGKEAVLRELEERLDTGELTARQERNQS